MRHRAGARRPEAGRPGSESFPWREQRQRSSSRLAVQLDGYSLEAGTHVHAHDRLGLLHLLRYGLRPPFSKDRLRLLPDGRVELELRRPAPDGARSATFTPHQLLRRLAALVPPPRTHLLGYHGVFAASSKLRPALAPVRAPSPEAEPAPQPGKPQSKSRIPWAELIRRVFLVDLLTCDKCGGVRDVGAVVTKPEQARELLEALGVPFTPLCVAKARGPPSQESFDLGPLVDGIDPIYPD